MLVNVPHGGGGHWHAGPRQRDVWSGARERQPPGRRAARGSCGPRPVDTMVAPRANRSCSTLLGPVSGVQENSQPELLKIPCQQYRHSRNVTACTVTGCTCRSLIRHAVDFTVLVFRPVSTSQTALRSTTASKLGIPCAPGWGSSVMAWVSYAYCRGQMSSRHGPCRCCEGSNCLGLFDQRRKRSGHHYDVAPHGVNVHLPHCGEGI